MMRKYDYRRTLPHVQKDNRPVFISFNTIRRWTLPDVARDIVLDCCLYQHGKMARVHAIVVMPEHLHTILTPLPDKSEGPFSLLEITQNIKSVSAHRINRLLRRRGPVWLEESFDHILRSSESLAEKVEYIRQNPIRRGLCRAPEEYPWLWVNPDKFDW